MKNEIQPRDTRVSPLSRSGKLLATGVVAAIALTTTVSFSAVASASPADGSVGGNVQARIVGGTPATVGNWPSIAAIHVAGYTPGSSQFCGGTLIASRWILTAAHCVVGNLTFCTASPCNPADLEIDLNRYALSGAGGENKAASRVVPDPLYNEATATNDNALIELATPSAQPVRRIVTAGESSYWDAGDTAYVAGWGDTDGSEGGSNYPDGLREVALSVVSDANCASAYGSDFSATSELCAGVPGGGKDSCQGDSGGPLEVDTPSGRRLIGVVSFGPLACGLPDYPGVYSRVIQSRDWIGSYAATLSAPSSVSFAKVKRGRSKAKTVTVSNVSSLPAAINSVSVSGKGFAKTSTTCPSKLENDSSCTVTVTFKPTRKGAGTGYLTVVSSTGVTYSSIRLTGTGY